MRGMVLCFLCGLMVAPALAQDYHLVDVTDSAGVGNPGHRRWGATWSDYNGDGWMDVYSLNGNGTPNDAPDDQNTLYRNNGDGTFTDVTAETGTGDGWVAMQNVWADYDRDGDLDLFSHNFLQSTLYQNNDNVFTDVNDEAGTSIQMPNGTGAAWGDYDNDGWLDLHANSFPDGWNVLFHNNGDGTFTDVQPTSGMNFFASAMGDTWLDYDGDGDQDLALSAVTPDTVYLYRNNGDGTFTDISAAAGIVTEPGTSGSAIVWVDYDNDGHFDLWLTEVTVGSSKVIPTRMYLFRNLGDGTFEDATAAAGLLLPDPGDYDYWDGAWADYDNDGDQDLYLAMEKHTDRFFQNNGDGTFTDITDVLGLGLEAPAQGVVWADYDNDGDVDYYLLRKQGQDDPNVLWQNQGGPNHWLQVDLRGTCSNLDGIGAEVRLRRNGTVQARAVNGGDGLFSQHSRIQHFGLGADPAVDTLEVRWPRGQVTLLTGVAADRRLTVTEPPCPDLALDLRAAADSVVIPPGGGSFVYTVRLTNQTTAALTTDLWAAMRRGGQEVTLPPHPVTLAAGETFSRTLVQAVPAGAPPGVYRFSVQAGTFPEVEAMDSFPFLKEGGAAGARMPGAAAWGDALASLRRADPADDGPANYPNPFNPATVIRFDVPATGPVRLRVFDLLGRTVAVLVDGVRAAGPHRVRWTADGLASGVYLYRLETAGRVWTRRMVLLR